MMKYCTFCDQTIDTEDSSHWYYRPNDGKYECKKRRHANVTRNIEENSTRTYETKRKYQLVHKDELQIYNKEWRDTSQAWKDYQPIKNTKNYESIKRNPGLMLMQRIRRRVVDAIKGKTKISVWSTVGCSTEQLKAYIESLFSPEMNWDNYGSIWVIDHIEPLCSFNLLDPEQLKKANNFLNLRPLLRGPNSAKAAEDKRKKYVPKLPTT